MTLWWLAPLVVLVSMLLTGALRRYALAKSIIDVPNARSSHMVPTPRGGGVAIVLAFVLATVFAGLIGLIEASTVFALVGGGGIVAVIGFMDDHGHIAARWRLLGHFLGAGWALFWIGGLPPLQIFGWQIDFGLSGAVLAAVYLVWMLNLYNFMDGIDGLASVEAISACLGASLLYWLTGFEHLIVLPLLLATAVSGFLFWNFPPARIFMGDAGSGFLGVILGVLALQAAWASQQLFWCWLILLGVFIVDATFTLMRRLVRGDKVYEAHRSHAYQFASRRYGKHLPVTLGVAALNLFWLLPVALCVMLLGIDGFSALLVAYAPLAGLALFYKAGSIE